jgi:kynurenine formamidase
MDDPNATYQNWIDELSATARFGLGDRLGTANLIDTAARERAAASMRTGRFASLARPLDLDNPGLGAGPAISVDIRLRRRDAFPNRPPFAGGHVNTGSDTVCVEAHGYLQTHLDSINHIGRNDTWYGAFAVEDPNGPSLEILAKHGLFTRGVVVDIPAVRGTDWVSAEEPVVGADIDRGLESTGAEFRAGDALLLYMGRDKFEAASQDGDRATASNVPGAGRDAARWVVEHDVSMVCWDFLDAVSPDEPVAPIHLLIWAIGIILVDNCDLAGAVALTHQTGRADGALIVAPPAIPRATGALVHPLFIQ